MTFKNEMTKILKNAIIELREKPIASIVKISPAIIFIIPKLRNYFIEAVNFMNFWTLTSIITAAFAILYLKIVSEKRASSELRKKFEKLIRRTITKSHHIKIITKMNKEIDELTATVASKNTQIDALISNSENLQKEIDRQIKINKSNPLPQYGIDWLKQGAQAICPNRNFGLGVIDEKCGGYMIASKIEDGAEIKWEYKCQLCNHSVILFDDHLMKFITPAEAKELIFERFGPIQEIET